MDQPTLAGMWGTPVASGFFGRFAASGTRPASPTARDARAGLARCAVTCQQTQHAVMRDAPPCCPPMLPPGLPPGPEWGTQRIQRKADLGKTPKIFQPPGTAGKDGDKMTCIFCACEKSAVVTRARAHVAGDCVGVMGITPCPGPKQEPEEDDAVFAARNAQFLAARAACLALVVAARATAALAAESAALDRLTAPPGERLAASSGTARPQKQLRLDATAALGLAATEGLARGWLAAGLPFNVLNNEFMRKGLRAVRAGCCTLKRFPALSLLTPAARSRWLAPPGSRPRAMSSAGACCRRRRRA